MDAFDADVLIYAASGHALGEPIRELFPKRSLRGDGEFAGVGSVMLLPELMSKPMREGAIEELDALGGLLGRLDLRPLDLATAEVAAAVGATYGLRSADAVHLATAIVSGADRFITNNSRDFTRSIAEVDVTYPSDLLR